MISRPTRWCPPSLASVIAYAIVISVFGESILFAHAPRYPFVAGHLPLYVLLAICVALLGSGFIGALHGVESVAARIPVPPLARAGLGGLALSLLAVPVVIFVGNHVNSVGQGLGILGGGYGAVQMAITGSPWLTPGWQGVELLLLLCAVKLVAASLTIGTGGSAGDFAPSLVLGGLLGGAFGRAAQLLLHDPSIDPGAFALVGMGTLYGGIAHVPISSLILVSELAGSYDLLVPLMLAEGVAFVALRNRSLYRAQIPSKSAALEQAAGRVFDAVRSIFVADVMVQNRPYISFRLGTPAAEVLAGIPTETWQDTFPVLDDAGLLAGQISGDTLRLIATNRDGAEFAIAADLMQPPVTVRPRR